ncbi:Remorin family protein [Forsythia ovata]|uniref:Remorin family protein n=2 Tax=Forsythia ovata TaxID=205694 RepID=A0ABD1WEC6_9LAMI
MRSIEDKGCLSYGTTQETPGGSCMSFEFPKGNGMNRASHQRTPLGKPTPSKWDDAQKWLVNLSKGGDKNQTKASPRNSNADDRRLIIPVPKKEYSSGEEEENDGAGSTSASPYEVQTKKVDCDESIWRINKPVNSSTSVVRSICVRDMGTEMTPIASQEPSRTATPIRATTPVSKSPICSGPSTPVRSQNGLLALESGQTVTIPTETRDEGSRGNGTTRQCSGDRDEPNANNVSAGTTTDQSRKLNPLETRAMAWDEAERAKYMARYKGEEVKIQAWENHQKRIAEMEMRRMEVKAERMKSRAQEKYTNKLASTRRIAEEKRANAEAKLNEKAVKTSERADYIRRTGHLPSSFSFKLPSFCW